MEAQIDILGRRLPVSVFERDGLFFTSSDLFDVDIFGFSPEHALSNLRYYTICLAHIGTGGREA
jgi:hypothetical protein